MADPHTRHTRGLLVVVALAVIFFTLLGLILVKKTEEPPENAATKETLTVVPLRIRIRTEPHARAAVIATATSGERLVLVEDRGAWVRVETHDRLSGWAERANLERTSEQERRTKRFEAIRKLPPLKGEATERVPLYAGPGIFYPLVGDLRDGANVTVYTRDHDFYAIEHGGGVAYADIDAIDISAPTSRQLDVATTEETTTAVAETATSTTATDTIEPPPLPEPAPEPVYEQATAVYSAVPPGGTQPEEIDRVMPRYPSSARRAGIEGKVVVRGIVRKDGTIDNVEVIKDLPNNLGEEARRAVSRWRFRPATFQGEPIDVYYTVTVNFRLQ